MRATRLRREGAKYLAFAAAAARRALSQRTVLVGRSVFLGVILFAFSRIWHMLGARAGLPGAGERELVWYLALTECSVLACPPVFLAIEAEVRSGDVACRVVRPVGYAGAQLAEALGEAVVRYAVLVASGAAVAFALAGGLPSDPRGLWLALPLGLLASLLAILCMVAIGMSAFWIVDTSPFFWIWQKFMFVLGGLLFPLELYPEWLQRVAHATPFPLMCWAPGRMALGWAPGLALASALQGALWVALLSAFLVALSQRARARLTVSGG